MQTLTPEQLDHAAESIIRTRDFCGDERETFIDWCADNNFRPTVSLYSYVQFEVTRRWRMVQRAAGVPEKYIY